MKITLSSRYIYFSKKIAFKTKLVYKLKKMITLLFQNLNVYFYQKNRKHIVGGVDPILN